MSDAKTCFHFAVELLTKFKSTKCEFIYRFSDQPVKNRVIVVHFSTVRL